MSFDKKVYLVAILEIVIALPLYSIYTAPISIYGTVENYWSDWAVLFYGLMIGLLVFPVLGLFFSLIGRRICFLFMAFFPFIAINFGVIPVPFGTSFYGGNNDINTIFIIVLNIILVAYVIYLYIKSYKNVNNQNEIKK